MAHNKNLESKIQIPIKFIAFSYAKIPEIRMNPSLLPPSCLLNTRTDSPIALVGK